MYDDKKAFIFDLDGTLWLGKSPVDGAVETIKKLQEKFKVLFFTNTSTKNSLQVFSKLKKLGFECRLSEVYTSSSCTLRYLKEKDIQDAFILGSSRFINDIILEGISSIHCSNNVVVGLHNSFNYRDVSYALNILLNCENFIVCNEDKNFPIENGQHLPGCGAIVGALRGCSGKEPTFMIGKPNTYMLEKITEDHNLTNEEIIVVGDSYESDIQCALNYGCDSIWINDLDKFDPSLDLSVELLENIKEIIE